jgi:hypothetical protein
MKHWWVWSFIFLIVTCSVSAELVAVSQMGYHPEQAKQAVSYTSDTTGTFSLKDASTNAVIYSGTLAKAKSFSGSDVNCQGNNPCLVGDFSDFTGQGRFYVQTSLGGTSPQFNINNNIFSTNTPTLLEFFNALQQENSAYHADLHSNIHPPFPAMADGSFIMEADQATLSLIRLGSAYRKNPQLFQVDNHDMLADNKPDMQEYIKTYVDYLRSLQGVRLQERTDGVGFRINAHVEPVNAFVPGPTSMTQLTLYIPGTHAVLKTVPVRSLCGADDGSTRWDQCISDAAYYYKCQIDEPCINGTYQERTAVLVANDNGYAVSKGWGYEFGCFADINLNQPGLTNKHPCQIFYSQTSQDYTIQTLLAYLEALPAMQDYSPSEAQDLFNRAVATYNYIESTYPDPTGANAEFYGAALFLLYEYTGNQSYLRQAHGLRTQVQTTLVSDITKGREFYWEEYVRHKQDIIDAGLQYNYNNDDPANIFRGKMYNDYKDMGPNSIGNTGERIFQFDNNIQFHNSRYMLIEGVYAAKTLDLYPGAEEFIQVVADNQFAWLTGMNAVQKGISTLGSPVSSISFVYGIGNYPTQFHSRYLINTGYAQASGGRVMGARGHNIQWNDGTNFVSIDGMYNIMGTTFGSLGNGYRGEQSAPIYVTGQTFNNGKTTIPGWISGAFDVFADNDVIFNFNDNINNYEFTESTNEMVALALELFAYQDARYNNRPEHSSLSYTYTGPPTQIISPPPPPFANNTTPPPPPPPPANTTPGCYNSVQNIPATCTGGTITSDTFGGCRTITCGAAKILACDKGTFFEMYKQAGAGVEKICIGTTCIQLEGYKKSPNFPICVGNSTTNTTTPPPTNTTTTPPPTNTTTPPATNGSCSSTVKTIPATCNGGDITSDTSSGNCRTIKCTSGANTLQVLACDKPDTTSIKQYFEMYKQTDVGSLKICIGNTCITDNGYAKSSNFPICGGTTNTTTTPPPPPPPTNTTNTTTPPPSGTSIDLSIAPWYPKGRDYIFKCEATGFTPTSYLFVFGDGNQNTRPNNDVYYTYPTAGTYTVTCTAKNSETQITDTLNIVVS